MGYKVCPKCEGTGKITCDGKEYFRRLYKAWATLFHLKPVIFNWQGRATIPGIAVAQIMPGGWHGLKVYVAVTAIPRSCIYDAGYDGYGACQLDERGVPHSIMHIQGIDLSYFDIINDRAFWYLFCHSTRKDELMPLDYYPENIELEDRKLITEHCVAPAGKG